jgi:hypothetical protein
VHLFLAIAIVLLFAAGGSGYAALQAPGNLLPNGGFEAALNGWDCSTRAVRSQIRRTRFGISNPGRSGNTNTDYRASRKPKLPQKVEFGA